MNLITKFISLQDRQETCLIFPSSHEQLTRPGAHQWHSQFKKVLPGLLRFLYSLEGPLPSKTLASYSLNSGQLTWRTSAEAWRSPRSPLPAGRKHTQLAPSAAEAAAAIGLATASRSQRQPEAPLSSLASSLQAGNCSSASCCIGVGSGRRPSHFESESRLGRATTACCSAGAQRNDLNTATPATSSG